MHMGSESQILHWNTFKSSNDIKIKFILFHNALTYYIFLLSKILLLMHVKIVINQN